MEKTAPKWTYGSTITFQPPSRDVHSIFLHCSASDAASHDDISVMRRWHVVDNGWSHVGYHFFINKNGDIQEGCAIEQIPIAQKGHNDGSIAICVHGLNKSLFTMQQMDSVKRLCKAITDSYDKKLRIRGHCEVSSKSCPVFDYKTTFGLDENGYYAKTPVQQHVSSSTSESQTTTTVVSKKINAIIILDKGPHVKALQNLISSFGFSCFDDGEFGQNTAEKVKAFQRNKGLVADGIVGGKSINAMFSSPDVILKRPEKGRDVLVLQLMLAMFGKSMIHDGKFGLGTEKALKAQQSLMGLKVDGVFGPNSRKIMLG